MKVLSGKEKIGQIASKDIYINYDNLFQYKGDRAIKNAIWLSASRLLSLLGLIVLFSSLWLLFSDSSINFGSIDNTLLIIVLPLISFVFFFFAKKLLKKGNASLEKNNKILEEELEVSKDSINIDEFIDERVLELIDQIYFDNQDNFIQLLSMKLLQTHEFNYYVRDRLAQDYPTFVKELAKCMKTKKLGFDLIRKDFFLKLFALSLSLKVKTIDSSVIFILLCKYYWRECIKDLNISNLEIDSLETWIKSYIALKNYKKTFKKPEIVEKRLSSETTMLKEFSHDLTHELSKKDLVITLGKDKEMDQLIADLQELDARILIMGENGVGKTQFINHLASKILASDIPEDLKDYRLISIDLIRLSESPNFRSKLLDILQEIQLSKKVIFVLENLGQIFDNQSDLKEEVINILKEIINLRSIKIIAVTHMDNYLKNIKTEEAFSDFHIVELKEASEYDAYHMVMDNLKGYEVKFKIKIYPNAVKKVVEFASKIPLEKAMPEKAFDLLNNCLLYIQSKKLNFLDENSVVECLKDKVHKKESGLDSKLLANVTETLHKRLAGEEMAVKSILYTLKIKKFMPTFLFYGPSKVKMQQMAEALAESFYGNEYLIFKFDLSQVETPEAIKNFKASLAEYINKKPFSVILFEEIEKANAELINFIMELCKEGQFRDENNKKVDLNNSIVITSTNAASKEIVQNTQNGLSYKENKTETLSVLRTIFTNEFLECFDKIVMFKSEN